MTKEQMRQVLAPHCLTLQTFRRKGGNLYEIRSRNKTCVFSGNRKSAIEFVRTVALAEVQS